jgi:PAS domain S-box-containing protein
MQAQSRKKQDLINELAALRQKVAELEQMKLELTPIVQLIRASEAKYRRLFESATIAIFQASPDGKVITANPEFARMFGYKSPEDVIASMRDILADIYSDPDRHAEIERLMSENSQLRCFENVYRRKDGSTFTGNLHIWSIQDADGSISAIEGFIEDITERNRIKEDLLRSHRLESLGILAGGIAHDFNNLIMGVQGYTDLARYSQGLSCEASRYLDSAINCLGQAGELTSRLITFSIGGSPNMKSCNIEEIIKDAVQSIAKIEDVMTIFEFTDNLWPIEVDEMQMKQCFYNLTTNAVEALSQSHRKKLTVRTENVTIHKGAAFPIKEGLYVKISLVDEGIGIREQDLDKVFDPYFSTKEMGVKKGMGLGLSVCYSVLKKHEGYIFLDSKQGEGTTVKLYLPVLMIDHQTKEQKVPEPWARVSTNSLRVLLMDDEPSIREIVRSFLELLDCEVTEAKEGQEAIDLYTKALHEGAPFDLVILDLTVRHGLGGQPAMERLLKIDPKIKAIISSGYVSDPVIEQYERYGFLGSLKKPFKGNELKNLVEKIFCCPPSVN